LLSAAGSEGMKLGDRAADIRACERSNKPQIARRHKAQKYASTCKKKLLYGRYLREN
jgi:hypothetical protein